MFSWPAILAPTKAKSQSSLHCPQNLSESPLPHIYTHTRISFRFVSNNARNPNRNLCAFCLFFVAHFKTLLYAVFLVYLVFTLENCWVPHMGHTHTHTHTLWYNYITVFNTNLPWGFSLCSFRKTPAEFSCFSCSRLDSTLSTEQFVNKTCKTGCISFVYECVENILSNEL